MSAFPVSVGDLAAIRFLDHYSGHDEPGEFIVVGRVAIVTETAVTLDWWFWSNPAYPRDPNTERVSIVRAAILRVQRLVEA